MRRKCLLGTGIIDAVYRMDQKMLEGRIRYEVR